MQHFQTVCAPPEHNTFETDATPNNSPTSAICAKREEVKTRAHATVRESCRAGGTGNGRVQTQTEIGENQNRLN